MCSNFLLPHITSPTRITAKSSTLIDNILSNIDSFTSGNVVTALSDHHVQLVTIANQAILSKSK